MNHTSDIFRMIVCVKQVPATAQAKIDPVTKTLIRSAGASVLNLYDAFAVEAALAIRDALSGKTPSRVTALSMGIPSVETLLNDLKARGVDEGVLLTDRAFAGADTIDTAYTLSLGVKHIEEHAGKTDLIICGHMAVDGDTAQIGPELAQLLSLPHVANVSRIEETDAENKTLTVSCIAAEGRQTLRVTLPALITVSRDINVPRLPSVAGIKRAQETSIRTLDAEAIGADPALVGLKGAATRVVRTFTPEIALTAEQVTGSSTEKAEKVRDIIGRIL